MTYLLADVTSVLLPYLVLTYAERSPMSACKYCGKDAGWFNDVHGECESRVRDGIASLKTTATNAVLEGKTYAEVGATIDKLIADNKIPVPDAKEAYRQGWNDGAVTKSVEHPLSLHEHVTMLDLYKDAGLKDEEMVKLPGFMKCCFSYVLWQVLQGEIDPYVGPVRFNVQPGETPVFGFGSIILYEERISSSYVGGYSGVSFRVARGMYYHFGGMKGQRVQTSSLQEVDYGQALITSHNFYFGGEKTNFRIPYNQIVRFEPYTDGIGIAKNHGKKQLFVVNSHPACGWFLYNVMQALANPQTQPTSAQTTTLP